MNSLLQSISEQSAVFILALIAICIVQGVLLFRLSATLRQLRGKWGQLMDGMSSGNLELLLNDHLRERLKLQAQVDQAEQRLQTLENKVATAKRHLGLVRFDAFEDVGGSQSFAMALYDDHGNGAVINGLIGRTDSRVYCKPLVNGRSDRTLSQEEARAVEEARSSAPRVVITS
jgi:hypothetical protein